MLLKKIYDVIKKFKLISGVLMRNKRVLVTGGLGFIGSHLSNELLKHNKVRIIDDLSTGNIKNIDNINDSKLEIIHEDLTKVDFDEITKDVHYIFHVAAMANVFQCNKDPARCNDINLNATIRLLESAAKNNVKKVVFSSSSAVYGNNANLPLKETEKTNPISPYGLSKANCELYLKFFHNVYGLNYASLRYFNIFGQKQCLNGEYSAAIPNFILNLLNNKQVEIHGDGNQTRDFIFIDDVVKANIKVCESEFNGIVNVASGRELSINEIYATIKDLLNSDLEPKYLAKRENDIERSVADINKMKKINLKASQDDLKENLIKTIEWYKKN